jgi:uncharacterized protein YktA (UPF0223 family)
VVGGSIWIQVAGFEYGRKFVNYYKIFKSQSGGKNQKQILNEFKRQALNSASKFVYLTKASKKSENEMLISVYFTTLQVR